MAPIQVKEKRGLLFDKYIVYKGKRYKKVKGFVSQVGDITKCLESGRWTTKGKYYEVVLCHNAFRGIIADDNEPMGIHDSFRDFEYYRPVK
ncbi:hypothetical protein P9Z76_15275 [Bacillus cereus]|nr:hypothetical protein [Bacillus cereus]MEC3177141.1 hypothetical protein [Bacillus cereus]